MPSKPRSPNKTWEEEKIAREKMRKKRRPERKFKNNKSR